MSNRGIPSSSSSSGRGGRGGSGGGGNNNHNNNNNTTTTSTTTSTTTANALLPPKRQESILTLSSLMDRNVRVKCLGGREVEGILRGYDDLVNLVLEDCQEYLRDYTDDEHHHHHRTTNERRALGLVVVRGTQVSLVAPVDGMEEIENPFLVGQQNDDDNNNNENNNDNDNDN